MADNTVLDAGSGGDTIASDDISGVKFPRSKIVIGADGVNDGDVSSANPLPVGGTILAAIQTAVEVLDNAISGSEMQVDIVSSAAIPVTDNAGSLTVDNAGAFATQVDGAALTALQLIDDSIATDAAASPTKGNMIVGHDGANARRVSVDASGHVQVDVLSTALPSGAATEAKQDVLIGHVDGVEGLLSSAVTALQIIDDWDEANRAAVNLVVGQAGITAGAGAVAANTPRVTLASNDPSVSLLTTIDVDTGNIATNASTLAGAISGTEMQVDVVASLPSGANAIGDVGIQGRTTGGLSTFRSIDLDESEEEVKATAGTVYSIVAFNTTAAPLYLKLYNATAAGTTVGTTTPLLTLLIPGNADSDGAGFTFSVPQGVEFTTAISAAVTTGITDADTGAPGANAALVQVFYK